MAYWVEGTVFPDAPAPVMNDGQIAEFVVMAGEGYTADEAVLAGYLTPDGDRWNAYAPDGGLLCPGSKTLVFASMVVECYSDVRRQPA